jgi:hypothetical protein
MHIVIPILAAAFLCGLGVPKAAALDTGVAGTPESVAQTRNYDRIFSLLAAAGATVFFPTFQTVEAPAPKSLGFEADFVPPCEPGDPAFVAARRHGIKLIVPASLLYPATGALPPLNEDPLAELIECAGRDAIFGLLSFDEPADSNNASEAAVAEVYARAKLIDPTLPVLMVHAPIVMDKPQFATQALRATYLERVKAYSQHADIVGFDVYPVTPEMAKIASPSSAGEIVVHDAGIRDYMAWLRSEIPDRKHMMVLQGFGYVDQYDDVLVAQAPAELRALARQPDAIETMEMAKISAEGGASLILWWGTSLQRNEDSQVWRDILATIKTLAPK